MTEQKDAAETWTRALAEIKLQMTAATFDTWLARSWVVDQSGSEWVIGVGNAYAVDWLTNRLAPVVLRTLARVAGGPVTVRFEAKTKPAADPAPAGAERDPDPVDLDEVPAADEAGPMFEAVREERIAVGASGALQWVDFYIKLKVAFRKRALRELKGARLSVFLCLALHVDRDGIAKPGGIEAIMTETDYSRGAVCSALAELDRSGYIEKIPQFRGADWYVVRGYAWFGQKPAPALWEIPGSKSKK